MPLTWVDEEHLARANLSVARSVEKMKAAHGDDQRNRDRVAVLGHVLARLQTQPHNSHRSAIGDLLETDGATQTAITG